MIVSRIVLWHQQLSNCRDMHPIRLTGADYLVFHQMNREHAGLEFCAVAR